MDDRWVAVSSATSWLPVAAAYVFGLASGWLFWGGRKKERAAEPDAGEGRGPARVEGPAGALGAEIESARSLAGEGDAVADDAAAALAEADEALKRANGRLKILLDAIRKARLRD